MAKNPTVKLNEQQDKEMRDGMALYEMTQSAGWNIVKQWLEDRTYHTWADPKETSDPVEWQWRELNAFHASNNAKEILDAIARAISNSDYLQKVQSGEIQSGKKMRI